MQHVLVNLWLKILHKVSRMIKPHTHTHTHIQISIIHILTYWKKGRTVISKGAASEIWPVALIHRTLDEMIRVGTYHYPAV